MDTFEKTIEKAKEFANVATKRTGEILETQKTKLKIASLKSKLQGDYEALGRIFYKQLKEDISASDEIDKIVCDIDAKREEIKDLHSKTSHNQEAVVCEECGYINFADAHFCGGCGREIK